MKKIYFLCALVLYAGMYAGAQTLDRKFASTNGQVNAIVQQGDSVYIGGSFSQVGIGAKRLARFLPGNARPDITFPEISNSNTINCMEPDGSGGAYLAGYFDNYDGTAITPTEVIHILSDGSLDISFGSVNTNTTGIYTLKKLGSRLYVGGYFQNIQSTARPYLAALNASTGVLDSWTPMAPGYQVLKVDANDSLVFIQGNFSTIENMYVPGSFAALRATDGSFAQDFPTGNSTVTGLKVDGNQLYLGGSFSGIGHNTQGLAKASAAVNAVVDYKYPYTDGTVYTVLPDGTGGYFIGGSFGTVGNTLRSNLAHILSNGSVDPSFNVAVNNAVYCLATDGTNLYFGGAFTTVNSTSRNYAASATISTGSLTTFNPNSNGEVWGMAYAGGTLYMGGTFTTMKGSSRNYAAAVTTANVLTSWSPNPDSYVFQVVPNNTGTSLFLCGYFGTVKGSNFPYVAKVNSTSGNPASWKPNPDNYVTSIALRNNILYLEGGFTAINGVQRKYFAAVDTSGNNPTSLRADLNSYYVTSSRQLFINGNLLYITGNFSTIQDSARNKAARIDLSTGLVDSWNATGSLSPNYNVEAIAASGSDVLIGGGFGFLSLAQRNHVASIDLSNNNYTVKDWQPAAPGTFLTFSSIETFYRKGSNLFCGGNFIYSDGMNQSPQLVGFDTTTGAVTYNFAAQYPNSTVYGLTISNNNELAAYGYFTDIQNNGNSVGKRNYLASYDLSNFQLTNKAYDPNGYVWGMFYDNSNNLIAAGNFEMMNYAQRQNLAAVNVNTGSVTSWNPASNGAIYALAAKDTSIFAGGAFTTIGTNVLTRQYLAALGVQSGKAITTWSANTDGTVLSLAVKDTILYAGGSFTNIKGTARNYGAAVSTANGAVKTWAPNPNGQILTILPLNNYVYIGGYFSTVKGSTRQFLAKTIASNGNLVGWNPNPDSYVESITNSGNTVYVGGNFSTISAQTRYGLAAYDSASNTLSNFDAQLNNNSYTELYSLAAYGNKLYMAGGYYMQSIGNTARGYLAGLDTATKAALPFNPQPDNYFNSYSQLTTARNKLFVGGNWSGFAASASPSYFAVFTLEPQTQASALNFTNLQPQSVTANFTSGSGENRLVVIKAAATPVAPADGKSYNANTGFKQGDSTGAGSFVVYSGSGSNVNITGLLPNHSYTVNVYEYNGSGSGSDYLVSPSLSGSFTTPCPTYNLTISPSGATTFCSGDSVKLNAPDGFNAYLWSTGATSQKIKVTTSGSYSVTCTDSNGCSGSTPAVVVTVNAAPSTPVITPSGSTTFCQGGSVTLTSPAATSYLWSTGATTQSIVVSTSGNYTVAVTNASGCSATSATTVVAVNAVPASPTISASGSTTLVCPGKTVTLTSSGGTTYLWSTGATSQSIVVSTAGSYTVKVTNAAGCQSASSAATVVTYNVCAKPTGLVTSNITATAAKLSWTAVTCAVGYQYEYRVKGTIPYTVGQVTGINKTITGLTPGTIYQWRVVTACKINPDTITSNGYTNGPEFTTLSAAFAGNDGGGALDAKVEKGLVASVMPNPARSIATVRVSNATGMVYIKLTDLAGKLIWQSKATQQNSSDIDVSRLAQGSYLIVVKDEKELVTLKLIKE